MPDANDMELLGDYARNGSEEAFAELVRRHIPLVYSAALRHIGMAAQAEEITQAVFIILARKAGSMRPGTILEGWLYETTRLTALRFLRGERRRHLREQEVYMQSTLQETNEHSAWEEISPLLDEALARLGKKDRDAVILRFFKEKSVREVAATMQMQEVAAQRRILRALEKMRKFFTKRGVVSTTAIIAGAISASSAQAAPIGLAKTVSAIAAAKGAAASASTLTLTKGVLKVMAWTKTQAAVAVGIGILLVAGTTSITVGEIQQYMHYPWQVPKVSVSMIRKFPPQAVIVPTIFDQRSFCADLRKGGGVLGICQSVTNIAKMATPGDTYRMVFAPGLPQGRYDYIARGEDTDWGQGWEMALRAQLKSRLGVIEKTEVRDTDVLLLEYKNPYAGGLLPPGTLIRSMGLSPEMRGMTGTNSITWFVSPISSLQESLQSLLEIPVIDQSGLTGNYDFKLTFDESDPTHRNENLKMALYDQLGLELVPTNMPIEMLVVEKAN